MLIDDLLEQDLKLEIGGVQVRARFLPCAVVQQVLDECLVLIVAAQQAGFFPHSIEPVILIQHGIVFQCVLCGLNGGPGVVIQ